MTTHLGRVTIAGAGPGSIDHLTIAVFRAIRAADVILYDALIGDSIIAEFPQDAEAVFVGKRCGNHAYTQAMITRTMVEYTLRGKNVLRLKGGDPSIFAHLTSELNALHSFGIEVTVLPGVSALLSAAAHLKVPLTAREDCRHIWITDGYAGTLQDSIRAMAAFSGTLVFYMGASRTMQIAQALLMAGINATKSAALVENAGMENAEAQRGTVADFAEGVLKRASDGPGIFLVGDTLAQPNTDILHEATLSKIPNYAAS
ncbi:MAG: Siroheme synthase [Turneriella sp.]|nr:Siroheme synthase [Turneriella sp.]